jgi:hypothetical protein
MDCPVCGNNVSPFSTTCLECGTDMVAFPLLDDLETQFVDTLKDKVALEGDLSEMIVEHRGDKKRVNKKLNRMYMLLLFPLMFFWCGKKNVIVADQERERIWQDSLAKVCALNEDLIAQLNAEPEEPEYFVHVVVQWKSLARLAKKYLNNDARWREIHAINPHVKNPRHLIQGIPSISPNRQNNP